MRVKINKVSYTQVNANESGFLIQNITQGDVYVIISDTQPADTAPHDFILNYTDGISNDDVVGKVWAKSAAFEECEISSVDR